MSRHTSSSSDLLSSVPCRPICTPHQLFSLPATLIQTNMHVSHVDADTLRNLQDSCTAVERHTVFPDALHRRVHSFDAMSGSRFMLQLYTCAAYSTLIAASKSQNGSSTGRISAPAFCKTRRGDSHFSACHCSNFSLACKVTALPSVCLAAFEALSAAKAQQIM